MTLGLRIEIENRININENLKAAFDAVSKIIDPDRIVFIAPYGSGNYNLSDENSDVDFKAVITPSVKDLILENKPFSTTIDYENGQVDIKDIRNMISCWRKMNVQFLEVLFANYYFINPLYEADFNEILDKRERIVDAHPANAVKAIFGMAQEKNNALFHPYPVQIETIEKYGFAGKQLHHMIRMRDLLCWRLKDKNERESYFDILRYNDSDVRQQLVNLKRNKINTIANSADDAKKIADSIISQMRTMIDEFNESEDANYVDIEMMQRMEEIKYNIMNHSVEIEIAKRF